MDFIVILTASSVWLLLTRELIVFRSVLILHAKSVSAGGRNGLILTYTFIVLSFTPTWLSVIPDVDDSLDFLAGEVLILPLMLIDVKGD